MRKDGNKGGKPKSVGNKMSPTAASTIQSNAQAQCMCKMPSKNHQCKNPSSNTAQQNAAENQK